MSHAKVTLQGAVAFGWGDSTVSVRGPGSEDPTSLFSSFDLLPEFPIS